MPFNADNSQNNPNNTDQNQVDPNQQINLKGSGGQAQQSGRVANFSTGANPQQVSGSGRFNNLNKYMSQNQDAGQNIGARINKGFGQQTDTQNKNISDVNKKIGQAFTSGSESLNQGDKFNTQLQNIGTGLGSFKSMEDRADFDTAAQQAAAFTQEAPTFNQFQNIQGGQAVNQDEIRSQQTQALQAGQNLNAFTQDKLNKINSEQGRNDLMKSTIGRNRGGYGAGNARFDQLFFESAPNVVSNLANTFGQANLTSQGILSNIQKQGQEKVEDLIKRESSLIGGLNTQTQLNQNLFNEKLGQKGNIDFINDLRNKKYNEYLNQLKTGQINEEVATELGLTDVNTYQPNKSGPLNTFSAVSGPKIDRSGNTQQQTQTFIPRSLGVYNTDLENTASDYLKKGRQASSMQDIASQQDFDAYQALQAMSGIDSGKLSGISTLDKSVQSGKNLEGQSLSDVITQQDQDYRGKYAGKDYQANAFATQSGSSGNFHGGKDNFGSNSINPYDVFSGENNYGNFYSDIVNQTQGNKGSGATGYARANLDQYINNDVQSIIQDSSKAYDRGGDKESNRAAQQQARESSNNSLRTYLDNIIKQSGIKNQVQLVDDKNNEVLNRAKRFSRFV